MKLFSLFVLSLAAVPGDNPRLPNIDFTKGTLAGWQGSGFSLLSPVAKRSPQVARVSSADGATPGNKGVLRYVFTVPHGTGRIRFHAHAVLADGCKVDGRLEVLLLGAKNRVIPRYMRFDSCWVPAKRLLPPVNGQSREYTWDVSQLAGKTLQIALIDQDDRPGCYVVCSGFRIEEAGEHERQTFAHFMQSLVGKHDLAPVKRQDTKHFTAWSNASAEFTAERLRNCEALYEAFLNHFRGKGFKVRPPVARLMVALFDSQAGFDAYLGQKMPPTLAGIYHPESNRLVIYDLHQNRGMVATKQQAAQLSKQIPFDLDRMQFMGEVERRARVFCEDANVSTTIHEAAHQVSFNCGLLNRKGDVPYWLAEGLACYCEPAYRSTWQGMGTPNYERIRALAMAMQAKGRLLSVKELVGSDDWRKDGATVLTGYAQSWALFRMLMEEQPRALRAYLALIYDRRAPEHRLVDFRQTFGADLSQLDRRHQEYLRRMMDQYGPRQEP